MKQRTVAKTTWEVVTEFTWGGENRSIYETRQKAREMMATTKRINKNPLTGKYADYIKSIEMYRVKTISNFLKTKDSVKFCKKVR